jgi:hypothetical protein
LAPVESLKSSKHATARGAVPVLLVALSNGSPFHLFVLEFVSMAKGKVSGNIYRDHEIKEDHSFTQGFGAGTGVQKRYSAKVGGKTKKGSLEQVKADIDYFLDKKKTEEKGD